MKDRRINHPSPRDLQIRHLCRKHGLTLHQARMIARIYYREIDA